MHRPTPHRTLRTSVLLVLCLMGFPVACNAFTERADEPDTLSVPPTAPIGDGFPGVASPGFSADGSGVGGRPFIGQDGSFGGDGAMFGGDGTNIPMDLGDGGSFWMNQDLEDRDGGQDEDAGD